MAAGLDSFEFVHGLVELSVEMRFVADDLGEVFFGGDDALEDTPVDALVGDALFVGYATGSLVVGSGGGHGAEGAEGAADDGGALEADEPAVLPEGEGDALDKGLFEGAVRTQVIIQASTMGLPFLLGFKLGKDGSDGEDAVLEGVETDDGLASGCLWAAFGYGSPRMAECGRMLAHSF